jgi:hypothetical protein
VIGEHARDPLASWLMQLAREAYPRIFKPTSYPFESSFLELAPGLIALSRPLIDSGRDARELLFRDEALQPITATGDGGVFLQASLGVGWHMTWDKIPYGLIGTGATQAAIRLEQSLEGFQSAVREALTSFRRLLQGHEDRGMVVSGLDGITISDGLWMSTPWGRMRSAQEHERKISSNSGGHATAILLEQAPLRLFVGGDSDAPERLDTQYWNRREEGSLLLALGCLLSQPSAGGAPGTVWTTEVIPGQTGWGGSSRVRMRGGWGILQVGLEEAHDVEAWCERVSNLYSKELWLPTTRLLRAIRERDTPDDTLIDAVIALESLFGAGEESETRFRVSAATAKLLAESLDERQTLRKTLSATYRARSRLVHGGESVSEIDKQARVAVDIATRSLQALFLRRPDLISQQHRGVLLLLEGSNSPQDLSP